MRTLFRSLRCTSYFVPVCSLALLWAACGTRTPTVTGEVVDCCTGRTVYEDPDLTKVPEFPGGEAAMYVWLGNRLTRPPGTEGVKEGPLVQFLVGCDGVLKDIAVKVPVHPAMDSLALDAVRTMPTWVPGRIKDRQVCTFHVIPVNFD